MHQFSTRVRVRSSGRHVARGAWPEGGLNASGRKEGDSNWPEEVHLDKHLVRLHRINALIALNVTHAVFAHTIARVPEMTSA